MIGPNALATAAHNLDSIKEKAYVKSVNVAPARSDNLSLIHIYTMLAKRFEHILHDLGMAGLEHPLFYLSLIHIYAIIGDHDEGTLKSKGDKALLRAIEVLESVREEGQDKAEIGRAHV